jgi:hypothetical protein
LHQPIRLWNSCGKLCQEILIMTVRNRNQFSFRPLSWNWPISYLIWTIPRGIYRTLITDIKSLSLPQVRILTKSYLVHFENFFCWFFSFLQRTFINYAIFKWEGATDLLRIHLKIRIRITRILRYEQGKKFWI